MFDYEFSEKIQLLIEKKSETEIVDFKQEWHESNGELMKDIICFCNTVHDNDCYIIIGINDETHKIVGMTKERRKQADILDMISNMHFAGDYLPQIEVKTIQLMSDLPEHSYVDIDVLIIYNTYMTPIYLKKPYDKIKAEYIYSRKGDRNTAIDKSADIHSVEMLWRKRFGLTKPPLEYIVERLKHRMEWNECGDDSKTIWYNIYKPKYTLQLYFEEDTDNSLKKYPEFFTYAQTNEASYLMMLEIKVNGVILDAYQVVSLDSGRLNVPLAKWGYINKNNNSYDKIRYLYYVKDTIRYKLLEFLYNPYNTEEKWAFSHYKPLILFFESDAEHIEFEKYVICNYLEFESKLGNCKQYDYITADNIKKTDMVIELLHTGIILNEMFVQFKTNNTNIDE